MAHKTKARIRELEAEVRDYQIAFDDVERAREKAERELVAAQVELDAVRRKVSPRSREELVQELRDARLFEGDYLDQAATMLAKDGVELLRYMRANARLAAEGLTEDAELLRRVFLALELLRPAFSVYCEPGAAGAALEGEALSCGYSFPVSTWREIGDLVELLAGRIVI